MILTYILLCLVGFSSGYVGYCMGREEEARNRNQRRDV